MDVRKWLPILIIPLLGACAVWETDYPDTLTAAVTDTWHIDAVNVRVPDTLTTTEVNRFFPEADIVWHGEAPGDRRAQVARIVREGVAAGAAGLSGARHMALDVEVLEFHAVSPVAVSRAPSAVHNVRFRIQARDTVSGDIVAGPDIIVAQLEAYTGSYAVVAALQGRGQRVRIVEHIAATTRGWLADGPDNRRRYATIGR